MGNPWKNGNFMYDLKDNQLFRKDVDNVIYALGRQQVDTVGNLYFLDIYLSADQCVEMHYHPNASELTYCISGRVEVSFINPSEEEWQQFVLEPGEAISIPQGFWHVACALADDTHLLATHDNNMLQTVFGSDLLRLTPDELLAHVYCLDENMVEETLRPITDTVIIGPPTDCERHDAQAATLGQEQMSITKEKENQAPMHRLESEQDKAEQPFSRHVPSFESLKHHSREADRAGSKVDQPMSNLIQMEQDVKTPVNNGLKNEVTESNRSEDDHIKKTTPPNFRERGAGMQPDLQRYHFQQYPQSMEHNTETKGKRPNYTAKKKQLPQQKSVPYGGSMMQPVHLCEKCLPPQ